ncbi:hypothetical protein C8R43DRAFT_199641 [Mycena crocata]|nr:hypothetical protein C8R43DRAFT_199641 [Mycena crocata]
MFKATESSLHLRVSELSLQIEHLEAQVVPLRAELSKYQYSKNPLPPPPEPVPLDRFPAFARPTAESAEGYAAYFTPEQAPARSFNNSPRNGDLLDKGKGKGKQPVHQSGLYNPTPSASVIIPGATPSQRVIPSDDAGRHAYHTHAPASAYVNGYANGYDQGYGTANGDTNGYTPTNYASTSSYQLPPRRQEEVDNGLEDAMGSLRLWGMPTASAAAIAPVVGRPPDSAPATMPPRRPAYVAPPSSSHTADDTSVSSQTTSSHTRPTTFRRSTVQIDGHLNTRPPPIYAPAVPAPAADQSVRFNVPDADQPANDARARHAVQERNRINRQSYSSWGTVDSNAAPGSGSTRGSMSEFGSLMNFPLQAPPAQAQRNSLSSQDGALLDRGLVATPRQDSGQPLGFVQPTRPGHAHSYSVPSNTLPLVESEDSSYEVNSLQRSTRVNNRQRTVPRRFSQLPTGTPEFGINPMPTAPPPIENALGLELGAAAASPEPHNPITAPTPRVQMAPYIRSWSNNLDLAR